MWYLFWINRNCFKIHLKIDLNFWFGAKFVQIHLLQWWNNMWMVGLSITTSATQTNLFIIRVLIGSHLIRVEIAFQSSFIAIITIEKWLHRVQCTFVCVEFVYNGTLADSLSIPFQARITIASPKRHNAQTTGGFLAQDPCCILLDVVVMFSENWSFVENGHFSRVRRGRFSTLPWSSRTKPLWPREHRLRNSAFCSGITFPIRT